METLAYLHLALAHEVADGTKAISTKQRQKLSTSTAMNLLGLTVALCLIGVTNKASAALGQGTRGKQVANLQQRLAQLGYFKENVTGYFGSVTKKAVVQFQQAEGLDPDGIVGEKTKATLSGSEQPESETETSTSQNVLQAGDRGDQVVDIQQRLVAVGFSVGEKGFFDQATEDAVRQFQQSHGLKADGVVGLQTLASLPAISDASPQAAPDRQHHWYEDKSAPLTPFIQKPD